MFSILNDTREQTFKFTKTFLLVDCYRLAYSATAAVVPDTAVVGRVINFPKI